MVASAPRLPPSIVPTADGMTELADICQFQQAVSPPKAGSVRKFVQVA